MSRENKEKQSFLVVVKKVHSLLIYAGETRKRKYQQPPILAKSASEVATQLHSYPGNTVYLFSLP